MTVTVASFKTNFPEFASNSDYQPTQVQFWLDAASNALNPARWLSMLDAGTALFVAHHLVLSARDQKAAAAGGTPGEVRGILTAKAVDKVSAGFDAASVSLTDGGYWNSTSYGIRFLQFARWFGTGGVQVGTPGPCAPGGGGYWGGFGAGY